MGGKPPPDVQIGETAVEFVEDAGMVSTDVEDFDPLEAEVVVEGVDQHLFGGDEDVEGGWGQGEGGGRSSSSMNLTSSSHRGKDRRMGGESIRPIFAKIGGSTDAYVLIRTMRSGCSE